MGQSPPSSTCNTIGIGYPLLNGPTEFGFTHPNPVQYTTDPKRFAQKDDLLFCVRGSTTGRMNWADQNYAIGRGIAALRHKHGSEYQPFLRAAVEYRLSNLLSVASGSTFPNVSKDQILSLNIPLPPLPVQREIAHILGSLDDKIDLNRRMNATLESMARALFKSWFVDFDPVRAKAEGRQPDGMDAETAALFPDSFEDSELGEIPAGWGVGTLGDEFNITMGQSPPGESYNETGEGLPFYQGRRDFGFRFPTRRVYCTAPTRLAYEGDTLLSVRAPVGDLNMALETSAIGRGVAALRHKSGSSSYTYYLIETLKSHFDNFDQEGTVFGSINGNDLRNIKIAISPENIVSLFHGIIDEIDNLVYVNELQTLNLSQMHETLLPRLMTGDYQLQEFIYDP